MSRETLSLVLLFIIMACAAQAALARPPITHARGVTPAPSAARAAPVILRPKEIDDVLVNPGMGIQTFQRFNGQARNTGLSWSEEGPTRKLPDAADKPDFPGSSVAYFRWFWSSIEPASGQYRWEIIDLALAEARAHHQALAIRLMPYDQAHPLPAWYRGAGARRANKPTDKDGKIWQPDFADPLYLKHWGALVAAAGARYDGHPSLATVDVSSIGYWGEGLSPYMPDLAHQKALIDIWVDAFKRTPLLMSFDEPRALSYGTQRGAGWRLDCLGDMRSDPEHPWSHMLDMYPQQVVRAGVEDVWRTRPVSLETCWVPEHWKKQGWDVSYILDQALRWHLSTLNIKSSAIPPAWKGRFEELQKKMGYRFVLRRLELPGALKAGMMAPIHMWWRNAGVAPVYSEYPLAIELRSPAASAVSELSVDVRKWLPGDAIFDGAVYVPETLSPGTYRVRVAMLDPRTGEPAIRLAIEGRAADGWYDLGEIAVE
jgi:hypothetical protein